MSHSPVRNQISAVDPTDLAARVGNFQTGDTAYVASLSANFVFVGTSNATVNSFTVLDAHGSPPFGRWLRNEPTAAQFCNGALDPSALAPAASYLTPGYSATTAVGANASFVGADQPSKRVITTFVVHHDGQDPAGLPIVYTLTVNGVDTAHAASLAADGDDGATLVFAPIAIDVDDFIGVKVLPTGLLAASPIRIRASVA